jgi:dTDP-4-amino-4,6-dideoxygalactose transaminase
VKSALGGELWAGDLIAELENAFAQFIGTPDAVAVPSGRAGLRFIFEALDLEPDAEVICSAFAYPELSDASIDWIAERVRRVVEELGVE